MTAQPDDDARDRAASRIGAWLVQSALDSAAIESVLEGYCERLNACGVPILRGSVGSRLLHPHLQSFTVRWRRGRGIEVEHHPMDADVSARWRTSPLHVLLKSGKEMIRRRLETGEGVREFPFLGELRDEGGTDYIAFVTPFDTYHRKGMQSGMITSWTADRPGGFRADDVGLLRRLLPSLAVAVKVAVGRKIAENLAATYLGRDAGRRVLRGEIERGAAESVHAAILFCDLRGFTALSDRLPPDRVLALLDEYFDNAADPIDSAGGQVLKFMGDGLLATFATDGQRPEEACRNALVAATGILDRMDGTNRRRAADGLPTMEMDIALNVGDVLYGNVGARDRLDFTIIGPAVNEASRIEAMCAELGRNLLISRAFADMVGDTLPHRMVSLGRHRLRGVRHAQELYTLERA